MKKKLLTIICGVFIFACILISCQSTSTHFGGEIEKSLLSSKTVFLEINMAEWQRLTFPLIDAGIYNNGLDKISDEFNLAQSAKINTIQKELIELYIDLFKSEIIIDSFNFEDTDYNVDFFTKKDKQTGMIDTSIKEAIAEICTRHKAEYALAFTGQMQTIGVAIFGIRGRNRLVFEIALFDNSGNLISTGSIQTEEIYTKSSDIKGFISLFDQANVSLKNMISKMGI